jgi:hypothetical protein
VSPIPWQKLHRTAGNITALCVFIAGLRSRFFVCAEVDDVNESAAERALAAARRSPADDTAETLPEPPRAAQAPSATKTPTTRKSTRSPLVATPSAPSATTKTTARPGRGPGRLTKDD